MFANPLWSVLILLALVGVYIVIRIKHGGPLLENNNHIRDWKARWLARLVAFRSFVAVQVAALLIALPDLIVLIAPVDFSWLIGDSWAKIISGLLAAFLSINAALKTKPDGVKVA
jgi:di/tricarboxylate transporter